MTVRPISIIGVIGAVGSSASSLRVWGWCEAAFMAFVRCLAR